MAFSREKLFPLLAGLLWAVFLLLDLTRAGDSTWVKFAAICLCAAAAWTGCRTGDGLLVAVALTLTVCADGFLLVLDRGEVHRLAGVSLFLAVQLLYALRLSRLRGGGFSAPDLLRPAALALGACLALWGGGLLEGLAAFYFLNLCINTAEAFALKAARPVSLFRWGLLLFVGCDLCVGAWNLGLGGDFPRVGMWLFYLPSQVLIVRSQQVER